MFLSEVIFVSSWSTVFDCGAQAGGEWLCFCCSKPEDNCGTRIIASKRIPKPKVDVKVINSTLQGPQGTREAVNGKLFQPYYQHSLTDVVERAIGALLPREIKNSSSTC